MPPARDRRVDLGAVDPPSDSRGVYQADMLLHPSDRNGHTRKPIALFAVNTSHRADDGLLVVRTAEGATIIEISPDAAVMAMLFKSGGVG